MVLISNCRLLGKLFEISKENRYVTAMRFWTCLLFSFLFLISTANAAVFDPSIKWRTIKTEHFSIHFDSNLEPVAQDVARILEEVHDELSPKMEWKPWGPSQVLLMDSTDESNGMASVMPYNWIILYVSQPSPDTALANYDNWLRTLIVHEYTHLLHFDAYRKIWIPFRLIFQKAVAPAGATPGWVKEGFAVYNETAETTGGRNRSSYSDMLLRAAILEDAFPTIDRAGGVGWRWPSYQGAYIFGGKFIEYLVDTYGWKKFWEFNKRIQSSIMLSMVNHQARNVYHKTFYELWREWKASLEEKYTNLEKKLTSEGITAMQDVVLPRWEGQFSDPVPSPDGKRLAYIAYGPHYAKQIKIKDLETGEEKRIVKKKVVSLAWSPDSKKIIYSALGKYKRYNSYLDLYIYDLEKKKSKKITSGKRARDPFFSPDSKEIIFVSQKAGISSINILNLETKEIRTITDKKSKYAHYANPRFSPDGGWIAVDVWKPEHSWKVYIYTADGRQKRRLTSSAQGMETSPWWTPDGEHVLYASDETGITNIYRAEVDTGKTQKLTNVVTGVFKPATSDGRVIYMQQYNAEGFYISDFTAMPPVKTKKGRLVTWEEAIAEELPETDTEEIEFKLHPTEKYCPLGRSLMLPRFIMPYIAYIEDAVFVSFLTGGADPLRWHNWLAGITYRSDANFAGYFGQYWYNRWRPIFGLGINDYAADLGRLTFSYADGTTKTVHYYEERRNLNAFMTIPVDNHRFRISYFYEDRMPITTLTAAERSVLNLGIFAGWQGRYTYNDIQRYPASISPEHGRLIKLTGYVTDGIFGSGERNEQILFAGDWREYIKLWHHQTLGLRAAGGMAWGDRLVQSTFAMGGDIGEGNLAQGGAFNYFALRGLPLSVLSGTRAMLFSAEYRFPIYSPQRGIGTWPIFLNNIHAAIFADYGDAWNAADDRSDFKKFFEDFLLGVGMELRGDFVLGHGLPVTGRLGYAIIAVNRDRLGNLAAPIIGTNLKYGMMILQVGTSF